MSVSSTAETSNSRAPALGPEERREVAFHEAGHTVMVLDIGAPEARLDWVGILPCRKIARAKGLRSRGTTWWHRMRRTNPAPCHVLHDAVNHMIVCAAGDAATAHLAGRRRFHVDGSDALEFDREALEICHGDPAEANAFKSWIKRRTMNRVRSRWPEIQAVAHGLLEHSELDRDDASDRVRGLFDGHANVVPAAPSADVERTR